MEMSAYLVGDEEKSAINQNTPNCNISQNTSCQCVGADCDGTIPVQSNECPCQWAGGHWNVDESRVGVVAEV